VAPLAADVEALKTAKLLRDRRAAAAPIDEVIADKHSVGLRVVGYIPAIWSSIRQAVMRVHLHPAFGLSVPVVDVVSKPLLLAASKIGPLGLKAGILPVLIESKRVGDSHGIHKVPLAPARLRARAYDPIAYGCCLTYFGLAGGQCAEAIKRIRSEAVISCDYVGVQSQVSVLPNMRIA